MRISQAVIVLAIFAGLSNFYARAEEGDGEADSAPAPVEKKAKSSKSKGGKRVREKSATDGSEAPDRFKADTVIKSQYKLNGQSLEVDPD